MSVIAKKRQPHYFKTDSGSADHWFAMQRLLPCEEQHLLAVVPQEFVDYALRIGWVERASVAAPIPGPWEPQGIVSDGSTASYYELPPGACELQALISHRNMNAQIGEIFRACYRYGQTSHSDELRDARKIKFYIDAEVARLTA
jgi:hypothetical protein